MQNNRFSLARRFFLGLCAAISLGLAGCQTPSITNLTPGSLPANPSQIYTISARIKPTDPGYVKDSVRPQIIIDGKAYDMTKSALGQDIFEFDYQLAAGRTDLAYYYLISYQIDTNSILCRRENFTQVHTAKVVGRYVLSLEVTRGPIGAKICIVGRGFTPTDVVYFDSTPVRTVFESPNALSFFVPAVEPNKNYVVSIGSSLGQAPAGTFRVDAVGNGSEGVAQNFTTAPGATAGPLVATPSALTLKRGEKTTLTFTTPITATAGGLLIDVTTDVPESVIMPEVFIPAGNNTVTITVEGGRPGLGKLFAKGPGVKELVIPVTVK